MTTRGLKLSSFSLNDMYTSCFLHLLNESADVPLRNYSLTHCWMRDVVCISMLLMIT